MFGAELLGAAPWRHFFSIDFIECLQNIIAVERRYDGSGRKIVGHVLNAYMLP